MSINDTSYGPLRMHTTIASLQIKRPGNDFDDAVLQISVWQSAHWVVLCSLLGRRWPGTQTCGLSRNYCNNSALREFGALNDIVIQGHDWIYVSASPELMNMERKGIYADSKLSHPPRGLWANRLMKVATLALWANWVYKYCIWYK
jgi:hypothetical protein